MPNNINKKIKYDIMKLVIIMSKYRKEDTTELGGYIVLGVIVGFFILIFKFVKLVFGKITKIIKEDKQKERQTLKEKELVNKQDKYIEKSVEDERLDNLNNLIQEAEEIYDDALINDVDVNIDSEYMTLFNIKSDLEDENIIDISDEQVEELEDEVSEIINIITEKVEQAKEEKEAGLRVATVLLAGKYLLDENDDDNFF